MFSRCIRNENFKFLCIRDNLSLQREGSTFPELNIWIQMGKTKLEHLFLVPEPFYLFIPASML